MLINENRLREAIIEKFGSLGKFAKSIKYSDTQISRSIKKQSVKFIVACKKAGIDIDGIIAEQEIINNGDKGSKIADCYKRIRELENLVNDQKQLMDRQENLLDYYKEVIDGIKHQKKSN